VGAVEAGREHFRRRGGHPESSQLMLKGLLMASSLKQRKPLNGKPQAINKRTNTCACEVGLVGLQCERRLWGCDGWVGVAGRGGFRGDAAGVRAHRRGPGAALGLGCSREINPVLFLNITLAGGVSGNFRKANKG